MTTMAAALALTACSASSAGPTSQPATEPAVEPPPAGTEAVLSGGCDVPVTRAVPLHSGSWAPRPDEVDGLSRLALTDGSSLLLQTEGGPAGFVAGVNLGATVPGTQPGEVSVTREDYRRWLPMIAAAGFRAVRVYTILPPWFYEELASYNTRHPADPLYLMHGVWIPEAEFLATEDLFADGLLEAFATEIEQAIAAAHGDITLPDVLGKASGTYTTDVSPWTYAWLLGVEWDPVATARSDAANAGRSPYRGRHFAASTDATPTETWLAEALDLAATELAERGVTVPIGFVNWPTTDPLAHPDEPLETEDLVGVDANHVRAAGWPAGTFASYHAYPYYPDFQRYEEGIVDCVHRGEPDPYAGYLAALRRHHHDMPVLITEFGVPSAWAHAHEGPQGRNQGDHSEAEAMRIDADLLQIIADVGMAAGFVFEWADEWFKFTWNTIDYELPANRRQLWMNPWTNEAHFGVLAIEPGAAPMVTIDGADTEWSSNGSQVILESRSHIREVRALKDEGYLYLRLKLDQAELWERQEIVVGFDLLPVAGGTLPAAAPSADEYEYALVIGPDGGQMWVAGVADAYRITYSQRGYVDASPGDLAAGSGVWNPHMLITNRPLVIPSSGESQPLEAFNAGQMRRGTSNPSSDTFDSRAAWQAVGDVLEVRIPYQAIGIADPSSRLAYSVASDGEVTTVPFERVGIGVALDGTVHRTRGYSWTRWQLPEWHERLKAGSGMLTETARRLMGDAEPG